MLVNRQASIKEKERQEQEAAKAQALAEEKARLNAAAIAEAVRSFIAGSPETDGMPCLDS